MLDFFNFGEMILQNIENLAQFLLEPPSPLIREPLLFIKNTIDSLPGVELSPGLTLISDFVSLFIENPVGVSLITGGLTVFITMKLFKFIWDALPVL